MRPIEKGDMVSFDTDLIGPYGYCCDISRSWVCDAPPSDEQRRIYADAHAHIQHNKELLEPGLSFRELTEKLRPLGEEFVDGRYGVAMHGVGLCDEYPAIRFPQDWKEGGYDGVFQEGMVMCVEALSAPRRRPGSGQAGRAGADHRRRLRAALHLSAGGGLALGGTSRGGPPRGGKTGATRMPDPSS